MKKFGNQFAKAILPCTCAQVFPYMSSLKKNLLQKYIFLPAIGLFLAPIFILPVAAQTFEINNQPAASPNVPKKASKKNSKQVKNTQSAEPSTAIGWGSSIEVGRMARAAQSALQKNNYAAAADFAHRAVQAAPQDGKLWFLLGYTTRLAGKYQQSLDAYQHGLQAAPNSPDGLSGLAQTYEKAGNIAEAKRILTQVVQAHPDRISDLLILGELYIQSNDNQQALALLQRGETLKPSSHTELLMAMAYMRLKEMDKARELLDRARKRDPRNVEIFRAVANFQREERDYPAAIATLKSAPRKTPEVLGDLAYTYELAGDKKQAAVNYARAADAVPKDIQLQLSAAQSQINVGDFAKAKSFLARAAAIDDNHYRLHAIRANLAKIENRNADAIHEYNLALTTIPGEVPREGELFPVLLRLNLAELYKDSNDQANARQQMALAQQAINRIQIEGPAKAEFLRVRASIEALTNNMSAAEADLKQAIAIDPNNINIPLQYAGLLWKTGRKDDAKKMYSAVLNKDSKNRYALEGLGYIARDAGDSKLAASYFNKLAAAYPNDYVAYLALGDLYTATREFPRADAAYEKAFKRAPRNSTIIANGANAAIEARNIPLAKTWVERAVGSMNDDPRMIVQRERYLFHAGKYLESARLGYKALQILPENRDASVYLAYDLYNLGRYDDVLALTTRYENVLSKEPNFPLLTGHVHKQSQLLDEAAEDYGRALERDPKMGEAYVNRGYVENDLQEAQAAESDFHKALALNSGNGVAHLGLAFSDLQLRQGKSALDQADAAEKLLGESGATHLVRATAYRQMRALTNAAKEYRAALRYAPDDEKLHLALADTLYHSRHYGQALNVLRDTLRLAPDDPGQIYAQMAHAYAQLHQRDETLRYIKAAEMEGHASSAILLDTGDALLTLGDRAAAMDRFARALNAPDADRVEARLAIAKLFVREGKWDDARQQVALAFAESRVGEAAPVTADNLIEAANIFLNIQDFNLAERYFTKAKQAGAGDESTAIGLANTYLAQGDDRRAEAQLASLGNPNDYNENYDYNLAMGDVYRHRHNGLQALTSFARANQLAGEDNTVAERALLQTAGDDGFAVGKGFSVLSDNSVEPIYDDPTIYQVDTVIFDATTPAQLPNPRADTETRLTEGFRYNKPGMPLVHGFFQLRDARGVTSLPSAAIILRRNTRDYSFNSGIAPTLRLGNNFVNFDAGVQFTLRRDSFDRNSAIALNENLFRQYLYVNTSSFGNWLAIRAFGIHEAGPFTEQHLRSSDYSGKLEFAVGHPWGKTAFITGYSVRDIQYRPLVREFFTTSTYAGIERKFGEKVKLTALGEYIRSWRVQDFTFGIGQAFRPAGEIEIHPARHWAINANFAYARGEGFHSYDNVQSGFFISYAKPLRRNISGVEGEIPAEYPLRISVGLEEQSFPNFAGRGQTFLRPVVRLTIF